MSYFKKVLIANRGEIAIRIARTLRTMGIPSVAIYSEADAASAHVRACDEAVSVGPAIPMQSYLNQERILQAAIETGADAIHPGYGFLSENASFAARCAEAGITFIGPHPEAIQIMGSKIASRQAAERAGVPIVPGTDYPVDSEDEIAAIGAELGYPIAIKASAGGGGYGMRVVNTPEEIQTALDSVRRDAQRAFGDTTVYVEKFFTPAPRHVEIQVLGDQHGRIVHLGERECSLQRRYQKVVEETPSVAVSSDLRQRMGEAAVALASRIGYLNAGTVECLLDSDGNFYFLEMNTRLQVEHPITEQVTGIDLVSEMIRIAAGEPMSIPADGIRACGHAIEARVYAEDPARNFMPSPGTITRFIVPTGEGIRVDSGYEEGSKISVYYDPLIAKLIAWGPDRATAIARLRAGIEAFVIEGVKTNLPFLARLIASEDFAASRIHTRYIDENLPSLLP